MTDDEFKKILEERQQKIQKFNKEADKVMKLLEEGKIDDDEAHRRLQKVAFYDM